MLKSPSALANAKWLQISEPILKNACKKGRSNAFSLEFNANDSRAVSRDLLTTENTEDTQSLAKTSEAVVESAICVHQEVGLLESLYEKVSELRTQ